MATAHIQPTTNGQDTQDDKTGDVDIEIVDQNPDPEASTSNVRLTAAN